MIITLLCAIGGLSSCSTSSKPATSPATFDPADWHLVRKAPRTYFPRGVPANHPTGFEDGSWILTGDEKDTQYFIPHKSTDKKNLIAQARTKESPDLEKRHKRERSERVAGKVTGVTLGDVVKAPFIVFYYAIIALGALLAGVPLSTFTAP